MTTLRKLPSGDLIDIDSILAVLFSGDRATVHFRDDSHGEGLIIDEQEDVQALRDAADETPTFVGREVR